LNFWKIHNKIKAVDLLVLVHPRTFDAPSESPFRCIANLPPSAESPG
jgi:hypothetical protein